MSTILTMPKYESMTGPWLQEDFDIRRFRIWQSSLDGKTRIFCGKEENKFDRLHTLPSWLEIA